MPNFFSVLGWVASLAVEVQVPGRLEELLPLADPEGTRQMCLLPPTPHGTKLSSTAGVAGRDGESLFYSQKGTGEVEVTSR